jgi:hypothetical protein
MLASSAELCYSYDFMRHYSDNYICLLAGILQSKRENHLHSVEAVAHYTESYHDPRSLNWMYFIL